MSGFGTWSYNVGIAVYAYDRTHPATAVAVVTIGRYLPALVLSWFARTVIDRWPRRTVALSADLSCAAVMAVLAVAGFLGAPIWLVTLLAAVSSASARVQAAAVLSLAADVVVESGLARASRLAGAAEAVSTAAGSAFAAVLLVRFSPPNLFVVNAVTFVLSAVLLATVRSTPSRPYASVHATSSLGSKAFWPLQAARGLTAYIYGVDIVLLTVIAGRQLRIGSGTGGYGLLLAATGLGGLIGVTVARHHVARIPPARLLTVGLVVYALPLLVFAASPPPVVGILTQVLRGAGSVLVSSAAIAGLQRAVPSAMSGRVFGATQSLVLVGTSAGALTTPLLLGLAGFTSTLVVCAVVPSATALALSPFLARFDRDEASLLAQLDPRLTVLRGLQLLHDASRSTLYDLADSIVETEVVVGTAVVREGDLADAFYVLVVGTVEVTLDTPEGPALLRHLSAPSFFGEIGLLRSAPRTSTVTAVEPCTVWRVPAEAFLAGVADAGVSGALSDTVAVRFATRPELLAGDRG